MSVARQLSVAQVSARLRCAKSTIRKLIASRVLRASRIGPRTIRISETDLQAYLDSRANVVSSIGTSEPAMEVPRVP